MAEAEDFINKTSKPLQLSKMKPQTRVQVARWVAGGWDAVEKAGKIFNAAVVRDIYDRPVLLFKNSWNLDQLISDVPEIGELMPHAMPPKQEIGNKKRK
eukprot:6628704-Pyramimonas_sp.AAC.1